MKYMKLPREKKIQYVKEAMRSESIRSAAKKLGISNQTLKSWCIDPSLNADSLYIQRYNERMAEMASRRKPEDPFPEGIAMAAKREPEELARENRDLRKKIAYLEDKVAYLETLYDLLGTAPENAGKKNASKRSPGSSGKDGGMSGGCAQ